MRRPSKSFEIALSAIACAVATAALTVSAYVDVLFAAGYVVAVFALMLPLAKDFLWGSALAYVGACLFAFLFGGIFHVLPFLAFFGLHPILNYLQRRFVKKRPLALLCFLGKAAWFDLTMWLLWATVLVPFFEVESLTWYPYLARYFFWILFLGGTLFFAVYDYLIFLCQRSVNLAVRRIGR